VEVYSATKKEILLFASKWMELESIIISEVNQVPKAKSLMFYMWNRDLIQLQQFYEKQVMLREVTYERGKVKGGS
jgi:hypothetical protein